MLQPLPDKVFGNGGQLHDDILFTDVMPTGEFAGVGRKVFGTHLVIDQEGDRTGRGLILATCTSGII